MWVMRRPRNLGLSDKIPLGFPIAGPPVAEMLPTWQTSLDAQKKAHTGIGETWAKAGAQRLSPRFV